MRTACWFGLETGAGPRTVFWTDESGEHSRRFETLCEAKRFARAGCDGTLHAAREAERRANPKPWQH